MSRTVTTIDYKSLAERIQQSLEAPFFSEHSFTIVSKDDLRTLVSLLDGMAGEKPVAWVEVADTYEGPYSFHGQELLPAGRHSLFTHPAPQPQPERQPVSEPTEAQIEWPDRADEGMLRAMIGWRECDARDGLSGAASLFDRVYHALYSHMRDRSALAARETK